MTLSVIGSGFGRTGTRSLKQALETLNFAPCHHMEEVFQNPSQVATWQAYAAGEAVDWRTAFEGYRAQIDWPGAAVWRELADAFPNAKVIHSVRPDDAWWNSFSRTIGKMLAIRKTLPMPPHINTMMDALDVIVKDQTFADRLGDKEAALEAYHRRTEEVKATIAPDRLLIFDVAEGWEPLCAFLGVSVPDSPFPHRNTREDFWAHFGGEPA